MKIQSLQVARFIAAAMVVCCHSAALLEDHFGQHGYTTGVARYGWSGVDLFFVISGAVITTAATGVTWRQFVARRCQRILPLYVGCAILVLIGNIAGGDVTWRQILATLTLWPVTDEITAPLVLGGWTLCFEALFYAGTALIIWRPVFAYPLLGGYVIALILPHGPLLHYLGNPIILEFLAGVLISLAPPLRGSIWALPIGVLLLIWLQPLAFRGDHTPADMLAGQDMAARVLVAGLPCALIIWGAIGVNWRVGLLSRLGDASYSIYLCHWPMLVSLMLMLDKLGLLARLSPDVVLLASSAMAVMIASYVHKLIERPALAFFRQQGRHHFDAVLPIGQIQHER